MSLPVLKAEPAHVSAHTNHHASSTICTICLQKLSSDGATDRTTIMRPIATLPVTNDEGGKTSRRVIIAHSEPEPVSAITETRGQGPVLKNDSIDHKSGSSRTADGSPKQFGSYEILCEISRGSFGVVYKAKQAGLDRIVALKVLLAGPHASGEAVERFKREAKSVARLKHNNIVPVYDIGTNEEHHYFAMEFVEGESLSARIGAKKLTISDALAIAEDLADALETAHQAGVIHRDIKPSNILVDKSGDPHITDFGLAKQVDLDTKYTMSGTTLGTPAYMPPEQARGEIERIDARSDVYAVGAVLYEMLTGQTPFAGRSVLEVVVAVINEPVRPPRQLNPKIHRDVQTIVLKCLEKDPRQRYDSAAELRDDLSRFRNGETIKARPAGMLRLTGRFIKRHYVLLGAVAAIMFAFGVSLKLKKEQVEAVNENKQLQQKLKDKTSSEAAWRPEWWFPPLTESEIEKNDEKAKLHKIPDGKNPIFQGMVKSNKEVWDLHTRKVKSKDGKSDVYLEETARVPGAKILVSPDELRFYGDVDIDVTFSLNDVPSPDKGEAPRIRIGLQSVGSSKGFDGIPFIAEFTSGNVRVIGPADLYGHTGPGDGSSGKGPPKLEVKAEKIAPDLVPGEYTLNIHRDGTQLSFRLSGPAPHPGCSIEFKDANLSNWVFKNTQLVVHDPPPSLLVTAAEVRRKYGDDDDRAFSFFRAGDYNVAEAELKVLATGEDPFKRARAKYQLGMIQEICQPQSGHELALYTDALEDLDRVESDDPRLRERSRLATELHLRKMVRFAKIKQWNGVIDELNEGWSGGATVGEPLAWELHSVLEMILKQSEPDAAVKEIAALAIFQRMGIEPGSVRMGRWAEELAGLLIAERRFDDLITLHKSFPTPMLTDEFFTSARKALEKNQFDTAMQLLAYITPNCRTDSELKQLAAAGCDVLSAAMKTKHWVEASRIFASMPAMPELKVFAAEVELQAKELADSDFAAFQTKLLPVVIFNLPDDPTASKLLDNALDKVCNEIIALGETSKLQKLHEALRGPRVKAEPRLASSFARAVQKLAQANDAVADGKALTLLKYCAAHVAKGDPDLNRAAFALAKPKAKVDEKDSYFSILTIQKEYPTPDLLNLARDVMLELNHPQRQRYPDAVMFYSQARVDFGSDARSLIPLCLGALEKVRSAEQRAQLLTSIWMTVNGQLEQQHSAAADRLLEQQQIAAADREFRLEYGDMELALSFWDRARETYRALLDPPKAPLWSLKSVEPELRARAGLRLGVLSLARAGNGSANDSLLPVLALDNIADEYKLAARFLAAPDQVPMSELEKQMKAVKAPLQLSEAEWDLLRGLRLRMDGSQAAAAEAFRAAESKSSSSRAWVLPVASLLTHPGSRSPDEDTKTDVDPSDKTLPKPPANNSSPTFPKLAAPK